MVIAVEKDAAGGEAALLLLERSRAITLQGRDRKGRAVVRVVGSYFPGTVITPSRETGCSLFSPKSQRPFFFLPIAGDTDSAASTST